MAYGLETINHYKDSALNNAHVLMLDWFFEAWQLSIMMDMFEMLVSWMAPGNNSFNYVD